MTRMTILTDCAPLLEKRRLLVCNAGMNLTLFSRMAATIGAVLLLAGCAAAPEKPATALPPGSPPSAKTEPPKPIAPPAETAAADEIAPVECPLPELQGGNPASGSAASQVVRPLSGEKGSDHLVHRGKLVRSRFSAMPSWGRTLDADTWSSFMQSCNALVKQPDWQPVCEKAALLPDKPTRAAMKAFFEAHFTPWQVENPDGSNVGLVTGYYEPLLEGSRTRTGRFRYPLYGPPPDLLTVDLGDVVTELKGRRLRGRLEGRRVVPYFSRADIELEDSPLTGDEIAWVSNPVDLFFLQIQGSGRIALPDGTQMRVGYADQNGHPFRSIGRVLVDRGDLPLSKASLQGIKAWATDHPDQLTALLNANPSYVFFREMPSTLPGPIGTLGAPLTGGASIAVDARVTPLGAPVFLDTTQPNTHTPLRRLVMAQDTGGAIYGAVRADFFWGFGDAAGQKAGAMKQAGRMWVLYPRDATPPQPN
jgi:membrane-bound lytic murein transglycosylase A